MGLVKKRYKNRSYVDNDGHNSGSKRSDKFFTISLFEYFLKNLTEKDYMFNSTISILFLNSDNFPSAIKTLENDSEISIKEVYLEAEKSYSSGIVIGKSDPNDNLIIDIEVDNLRKKFVVLGSGYNIPIKDVMVFSRWGFSSYRDSEFRLNE